MIVYIYYRAIIISIKNAVVTHEVMVDFPASTCRGLWKQADIFKLNE